MRTVTRRQISVSPELQKFFHLRTAPLAHSGAERIISSSHNLGEFLLLIPEALRLFNATEVKKRKHADKNERDIEALEAKISALAGTLKQAGNGLAPVESMSDPSHAMAVVETIELLHEAQQWLGNPFDSDLSRFSVALGEVKQGLYSGIMSAPTLQLGDHALDRLARLDAGTE